MESNAIQVDLKQAEKIRVLLIRKSNLRKDLRVIKNKEFVYFPIKDKPVSLHSYQIIKKEFQEIQKKPSNYKDVISLPDKLQKKLPTSYDIIGHVALIKLKNSLLKYKNEIGNAILYTNKNVKTVGLIESVTGELRKRKIQIIAGDKKTKTIHTEYGLKFEIDIKKSYYSPRLANERKRVANLVNPGEIIVDMFTGVAPFSIMIGKFSNPKIIIAIDKNKEAVEFAKTNIKINNLLDKIEVFNVDAKNIANILNKRKLKADRIIMNLPFSAHLFFQNALRIAADRCKIHYYDILEEEEFQKRMNSLNKIAEENSLKLEKMRINKIKSYSPREFYIGIDITAKK